MVNQSFVPSILINPDKSIRGIKNHRDGSWHFLVFEARNIRIAKNMLWIWYYNNDWAGEIINPNEIELVVIED